MTFLPASIRQVTINGTSVPSRIDSILFWLAIINGEIDEASLVGQSLKRHSINPLESSSFDFSQYMKEVYDSDVCVYCTPTSFDDVRGYTQQGIRNDKFGQYYCLCELLKMRAYLGNVVEKWGSRYSPHTLDELRPIASTSRIEIENFQKAVAASKQWIETPNNWMVYTGSPGIGKTHILSSLMSKWAPWAMYIVAGDFSRKMWEFMGDKQYLIGQFVTAMMYHPILIIDDLGIEYQGAEWIQAQMDNILEFRSRDLHWWNFLTVIGTNVSFDKMDTTTARKGDKYSRTASRLKSIRFVKWYGWNTSDYRQTK